MTTIMAAIQYNDRMMFASIPIGTSKRMWERGKTMSNKCVVSSLNWLNLVNDLTWFCYGGWRCETFNQLGNKNLSIVHSHGARARCNHVDIYRQDVNLISCCRCCRCHCSTPCLPTIRTRFAVDRAVSWFESNNICGGHVWGAEYDNLCTRST